MTSGMLANAVIRLGEAHRLLVSVGGFVKGAERSPTLDRIAERIDGLDLAVRELATELLGISGLGRFQTSAERKPAGTQNEKGGAK